MKLYEILGTSGRYQWYQPPAKGYCASCSRFSFCLQGGYPVSGCGIGKLHTSIYAVYAQHRREIRHGKVLFGVIEFWCGGTPLSPRRSCPCWARHKVSCAEERGMQSVKDAEKGFEDHQRDALFIWG